MNDAGEPTPPSLSDTGVRRTRSGWSSFSDRLKFLKRHIVTVATAGAVLSGLVGYWTTYRTLHEAVAPAAPPQSHEARPPAMSVVVSPLLAARGDSEAARLADTLSRDLASRIGRAYGDAGRLRMIVFRSESESNDIDPIKVGRRLDSRYVLQGSLLRSGDSSLVNLQLVDASTGAQVWSDRSTLQNSDVSAQSSVKLRSIAHHLWTAVISAEKQRVLAQTVSALNPPELVLQAISIQESDGSLAGVFKARKLLDNALKLDPNCVQALIVRFRLSETEAVLDPSADTPRIFREMDEYTARAVALDPTNSSVWSARAIALFDRGRWEAALEAIAAAVELDPEDPELLSNRAGMLNYTGRPAEALPLIERALAMDTSVENVGYASRQSCIAHLLLGHTGQAVVMCEKAQGLGRVSLATTPWMVAAYAINGDAGKAAAAKAELLRIAPRYSVTEAGANSPGVHPEFGRLLESYFFKGLREAGIPEK